MINGMFDTGSFAAGVPSRSFASMITRLMPNGTAPLFGLTSMLASETAQNTEHGFYTKTMVFPEFTINNGAGYAAGDTTFVVDSQNTTIPGAIMRNERTGENIIVDSAPSATGVTVTRGVGTVAAAAILDNDVFYRIGSAFEEASDRPMAQSIVPVKVSNLTQIFRNTWALSGTVASVEVDVGDSTIAENKQDCAAFHSGDIERSLFFSQKSEGVRNGKPFRTMDGVINIIEDAQYYPDSYGGVPNTFTAGATTNWSQLEGFLDPVFDQATDPKGANERLLFCGGKAKLVLNNIGRLNGTYQLVDGQTNWGLQFSTLTTARGKFRIIEHPQFNTNVNWAKMAVALDLPTFKLAYLRNRKTQNKEFNTEGKAAADNGIDAVGGTLTTELTALVKNPPANCVIRNLTAAAQG